MVQHLTIIAGMSDSLPRRIGIDFDRMIDSLRSRIGIDFDHKHGRIQKYRDLF